MAGKRREGEMGGDEMSRKHQEWGPGDEDRYGDEGEMGRVTRGE